MHHFQSYYGYGNYSNQSLVNVMDGGESESILSSSSKTEVRKSSTANSCKSHKETERRRRQRINAHFSTLRSLLPNATKTDKASLLAQVVHHVRELQKQAADVARPESSSCSNNSRSRLESEECWPYPGEIDEVTLMSCFDGEGKMIKVSVCCDERPSLNRDLTQAIRSVRARVVRAGMMTVAGRTKSVVVMQWDRGSGGEEDIVVLKRALNAVVQNQASSLGQTVHGNKRARVCSLDTDGNGSSEKGI